MIRAERPGGAEIAGPRGLVGLVRERPVLEMLARSDARVIAFCGPHGSGKGVAARYLHSLSSQHSKPFVHVNAASLSGELAESLLFGHRKGAFSGATDDRPGRFDEAEDGFLFLDEITDLDWTRQGKLLVVLQDRTYRAVGDGRDKVARCRVLVATNRNVKEEIAARRLREDLWARMAEVVELRPLRERRDEIPAYVEHFAKPAGITVSEGVMRRLSAHEWPGNVRELENVVEALGRRCAGREVQVADLPEMLLSEKVARADEIRRAFAAAQGNLVQAAKILGVSRMQVYRELDALGLEELRRGHAWRSGRVSAVTAVTSSDLNL